MKEKSVAELVSGEKFMLIGTDFRVWVCDWTSLQPTGDVQVFGSRIKGDGNVAYVEFTFAPTAYVVVID